MKTLLKWFVKRYVNKAALKAAIRSANEGLARKEAGERTAKVLEVTNDVAEVGAAYCAAYADDGRIDEAELSAIGAKCDEKIDKYLSDALVDSLIDRLFA